MPTVRTALAAAALILCWRFAATLQPHQDRGILPIDPPTPFIHYTAPATPVGRVLVVHGLDVSKEFMQTFCAALSDSGFEVYSIDLPGHGDSSSPFSATIARNAVAQVLDKAGAFDVVIGHSLGAGILLDLANERSFPKMVLLSPPPTPLDYVDFSHTLVVTGDFDIPAVNYFIPKMEGAEWWRLPWAAHSTAVFNARQTRAIVQWMGGRSENVRTTSRVVWNLGMLIAAITLGVFLLPGRPWPEAGFVMPAPQAAARFVLAGAGAAIVLRFFPVLGFLHIFATDYLMGSLLIIGAILCVGSASLRQIGLAGAPWTAVAAAAYVIAIVGFLAAGNFMHFSLNDGRWWRFVLISLASFPLFLFDEVELRRRPGWNTALIGIVTRAILGATILMGVLTFNRSAVFLVLLIHLFVMFWIGLWFLTHVVRRHTQNPVSAAIFASLVQGWLFAAWFITT